MYTTYNDLFDTQYEQVRIINRLKYMTPTHYLKIIDYIMEEEVEIQLAFWALLCEFRREQGWEDEEFDEYIAHTNYTLVENFANRYGWTRNEMVKDFFGV